MLDERDNNGKFVKGHISWLKGKHLSKETIEKMRLSHLGKKYKSMSEKGRKNISLSLKGKIPKNFEILKQTQFKKGHKGYKAFLGKHHSEESKRKISEAFKGNKNSKLSEMIKGQHHSPKTEFKKGNKGYWLGKHRSEKTKQKLKIKNREVAPKGDKSPLWKGGISFEPYTSEFNNFLKFKIRQRDDFSCQLCRLKENGQNHCVHHIDYDKKNCNPDNLITLCHDCHIKTNIDRVYWTNYFGSK